MADPIEGVTQPESPTDTTSQIAAGSPVTEPSGHERPVENLKGEFDRKFSKLQQQQEQILAWLAATTSQPAQPQPTQRQTPAELSDEELWALAQQGDRKAFELYQQRIADRRIAQASQIASQDQLVQQQLNAIMSKYPVLNDASHPLTQTANAAYSLYLRRGYPANNATLLEAAKTAIADRPDLVTELHSASARTRDTSRQSATRSAQAGQTGATHRSEPSQGNNVSVKPLTADELALARRMGVKGDPLKAKERFVKRLETPSGSAGTNQVNIGQVGSSLDLEDF